LKTKVEILGETWKLIAACSTYYDKRPSALQEVLGLKIFYFACYLAVLALYHVQTLYRQIVYHVGKK
jgi:hypothetical protein